MTPDFLEQLIAGRSADVLRLQERADESRCMSQRMAWRDEARRAAADVARMVAMREPDAVRQMEQARGLA
ncbi:MAG: hypothetical protein Q4F13_02675 [Pseudomonadota bacterium]|nr:hypothetical protein [Pseudomonadota bacterium]